MGMQTEQGRRRRTVLLAAAALAGDDAEAVKLAERLVREAGFDPVRINGLAKAKDFDVGTPAR